MKLNFGTLIDLLMEVKIALVNRGLVDANGEFVTPFHAVAIAEVSADVEQILVKRGVAVQSEIDKVIQAIPAVLLLIGVK